MGGGRRGDGAERGRKRVKRVPQRANGRGFPAIYLPGLLDSWLSRIRQRERDARSEGTPPFCPTYHLLLGWTAARQGKVSFTHFSKNIKPSGTKANISDNDKKNKLRINIWSKGSMTEKSDCLKWHINTLNLPLVTFSSQGGPRQEYQEQSSCKWIHSLRWYFWIDGLSEHVFALLFIFSF